MRFDKGTLGLSPSDLTVYLACPHATTLSIGVAQGRLPKPQIDNPDAEMLWRKGNEHEQAYLAELVAEGRRVVEIDLGPDHDYDAAVSRTIDAMRQGAEVIYQAAYVRDGWRGLADFVLRVDRPSDLGDHSYEVLDTKLSRSAKPSHLLQLLFYNEEIARIQGLAPAAIHVRLGSGETASFRPDDFAAYYRRIRARFERFTAQPPVTSPYPCAHCSMCDFAAVCEEQWETTDHLSRVARIQRRQVDRLTESGIITLDALASLPEDASVAGITSTSLAKIRAQAALQRRRTTERPIVEVLPPEAGTGFALLPDSSPGDLFFDIEGHPFWDPSGGLEYLWGVIDVDDMFDPVWAESHAEERVAFEQIVDRIRERLAAYPGMHVYHYAAYEITALRRLAGRCGSREEELDDVLRRDVFVDLYAVVRNAIRASERGYGLKDLEVFLPITREAAIKDGGSSIVAYEQYLQTKDPAVLDAIGHYNREDCISTRLLRDWLLGLKAEAVATFGAIPVRAVEEPKPLPDVAIERAALRESVRGCNDEHGEAVALIVDYHQRERRPAWRALFDQMEKAPEELVDDAEAIGLVEPTGEPVKEKQSWVYEMTYPPQEHKLREGDTVHDPATRERAGTISRMERDSRTLWLKRGPSLSGVPLPRALLPPDPYRTPDQEDALARIARSVLAGDRRYPAAESILRRTPFDRPVQTTDLDELKQLVRSLDGQHLAIQGPPGSGKTWTAGHLIAAIVADGGTVGIASTSHKAIHNVLKDVEMAAAKIGLTFDGRKKSSAGNAESRYESLNVTSHDASAEMQGAQVAAGTAWLFSREEYDGAFDYLVIDEAGQVALADALAMSTCARNVILLGDPQQLAQVVQAHHPAGTGVSVLEHLLGDDATVPPDRGVFLESTYRLHPDVCGYISECFYEGRLQPDAVTATRTTPMGTGLRYLSVEHDGCRQSSPEEVEAVVAEVARLCSAGVAPEEIMVVAAFNAQVDLLRERLPHGVRAGTVDKFQGQQADVVFYSMASSSHEDVPRGLDFLLSRNRLNVAISRARCLAYLVASPRLLEVDCHTIEHMRLANSLCRFVEIARPE